MTRGILEQTFLAALLATSPAKLVRAYLPDSAPTLILAIGKAAVPMLVVAREAYPRTAFMLVAPENSVLVAGQDVFYAGHPIPNEVSVAAATRALQIFVGLSANDHVLLLISGGGSALFCAPNGITLGQKQDLTRQLLRSGADIIQLNTVRKHLSKVKGGQLVAATKARVTALLLSDVVNDDVASIASGLSVPDPSTFSDAMAILEQFGIDAPEAKKHLLRGVHGEIPETPKILETRVVSTIIGSNKILLEAAKNYLTQQGVNAVIVSDALAGEARELAYAHVKIIRANTLPIVLLSGGEATETVRGTGIGGRNQEFLLWLLEFLGQDGIYALSVGSDGIDGTSLAAGAIITPDSWQRAKALGLEPREFLANNDSGTFFERLGDQVLTGLTGHNLNDFRIFWL